jgi:glycosyltransferase involved in cell wall biosynthesis
MASLTSLQRAAADGRTLRPGGRSTGHRPLLVGVDGGCWLNRRGYGRYARSVLRALAERDDGDRYLVLADTATVSAADLPGGFGTVAVRTRPPTEAASASGRRSVPDLLRMGWAAARQPLDVLYFPSVYTFFPLWRRVPAVVTIHDVIPERHPGLVFGGRRNALFWRLKLRVALRQARLIVTTSDHARDGIAERLRVPRERIRVVIQGTHPVFRRLASPREPADLLPDLGLPRGLRYLLYVGGLSPHKNVGALVEAYRRVVGEPALADVALLLVGDHSHDSFLSAFGALRDQVEREGLGDRVRFTGFVPDEALVDLYNRADLVVLPSLEEGFGLPAFEAAACGTPVVVSDVGPAAALLGSAARAFPPRDTEALAAILRELLQSPERRRAMGAEGLRRAPRFTWDRAAAEVHDLLHEAAGA